MKMNNSLSKKLHMRNIYLMVDDAQLFYQKKPI